MPPYRIEWLEEAKADVRALDQPTAMRLFEGILRFARNGSGDVNALHGDMAGAFRLRLGDYRVLFTLEATPCASSASAIAPEPTAEILFGGLGRINKFPYGNRWRLESGRSSAQPFLANKFAYANAAFAYANPLRGDVSPLLPARQRRRWIPKGSHNRGVAVRGSRQNQTGTL